jgi:3-methylcrotonyl-CoA carboxylase alpha subunit
MITGLDLVEWQLRVAAGEPLPLSQSGLTLDGHAIEARIYAEDPSRDFLPSIGTLAYLRTPEAGGSVRIDTGVREGDEITPYYDPMIAKLIVHGPSREAALARLRAALAQYHVAGVSTNVEFLSRLVTAPSFVEGRLDTALIERERLHLFPPAEEPADAFWDLAARAALRVPDDTDSPWGDVSGWRLNGGRASRPVRVRCGEWERVVPVRFGNPSGQRVTGARAFVSGDTVHVFDQARHHVFTVADPYLPPPETAEHHGGLTAPMPGRVLAVLVEEGRTVARGTPLVVMEAMKMEHTVTAPRPGLVGRVFCAAGDQVKEGAELLVLTESEST